MHEEIAVTRGTHATTDRYARDAREYYVRPAQELHINSSWDGDGSKCNYYAFDAQGNPIALPAHAGCEQFDGKSADVQLDGKPYAVVVSFPTYRGKSLKPAVYLPVAEFEEFKATHAQEMSAYALTDAQLYALAVTAQLKSSGRRDEFARNFDATLWDATREQLRDMQLLRKNNAITSEGRNLARNIRLR